MTTSGSLYLSRVTGGTISETEARQVLSRFGALEKVWYCSQTDKEMFRLPEGIWIMFAFFQDCRDAQAVRFPLQAHNITKNTRDSVTIPLIDLNSQECLRTFELALGVVHFPPQIHQSHAQTLATALHRHSLPFAVRQICARSLWAIFPRMQMSSL